MTPARQEFIDAQRRMLDRYGIEVQSRFVPVPSPLMAQLTGFRLFAVDLPAYGLTDTVQGLADDLRPSAVRFLDEVLDGLGLGTAAFVANSLGSLWACWLALDRPTSVTALVHIGCPALVLDSSAPLPMRLLSARLLGRLLTRLDPPSPKQVVRLSKMVREHPLVPELADLLLATEQLPGFRDTFLSTLNALLRLRGTRPQMRLTASQLARIGQPTLLFWGKDDTFGPPEIGERVAGALPRAELHVVDAGHAPWLTQAEPIGSIATPFLHQHA